MAYRNHEPVSLENFGGLWEQGDAEEVPPDHFTACENIRFVATGNVATRFGVDKHQTVSVPLGNVVRIYNFQQPTGATLLALTYDGTTGKIYHVTAPGTIFGPIMTIVGMEDFAFVPWANRAYITPFKTYGTIEKGLQSEALYVYMGDGTVARKAAGIGPPASPTLTVANGATGYTDPGIHLFAVVFEYNTGYLSPPGAIKDHTTVATKAVDFTTVPLGPGPPGMVVKRHIVATKKIATYSGNTTGYQFYFIPDATIPNNSGIVLSNISFYDADLLEDASYLLDNYAEIPAGCSLSIYHNRLCLSTTFDNIHLVLVSQPGEPEAIDQVSGLIETPKDGTPVTVTQELRDVFYVLKRNRTFSYVDNQDDPVSWPLTIVDAALGSPVHGIATVIDSGSSSVDYLIVATSRGLTIFNGKYQLPELSYKISEFWLTQDKEQFRRIQVALDVVNQVIYTTLPDRRLLIGDYNSGLDSTKIKWAPWRFDFKVNTIAMVNIDELIIASEGGM